MCVIEAGAAPGLVTSYANGAQLTYSYVVPLAELPALTSLPKWVLQKEGALRIHPSLSLDFFTMEPELCFILHHSQRTPKHA